jgi:multicomponent Na+:H+ antiporter subunit E
MFSMYLSSIQMLAALIRGKANPRVVHFRTRLKTDLARMVLANSITFTPGTITLDLNDDHLTVHWFLASTRHSRAAGDIVKGKFEDRLRRVWS